MSLPNARLCEFLEVVPAYPETVSLSILIEGLGQSGCDRGVLVNSTHQPTGLVSLRTLFPHFLTLGASPEQALSLADLAVLAKTADFVSPGSDRPLATLHPPVIEALPCLAAELTVSQFMFSLRTGLQPTYAIVNSEGAFLGLLDLTSLLRRIIPGAPFPRVAAPVELSPMPLFSPQAATTNSGAVHPPQTVVQLTQQLLAQTADLEMQVRTQQELLNRLRMPLTSTTAFLAQLLLPSGVNPSPDSLNSQIGLIDRLPIPIMVQTGDGRVILQNATWCQQLGEVVDSVWLGQEIATLLEAKTPSLQSGAQGLSHTSVVKPLQLCQISDQADSCICTCPLKNGEEQVLQFLKISLGSLPPSEPALAPNPPDANQAAVQLPFRLATLMPGPEASALTCIADKNPAQVQAALADGKLSVPQESVDLWLIMAQDVTQQHRLARELTAKNADLIQLNRLKDEFLACISHELRTPLTAVLGLSSLLKDQTLGELNPRQAHYAHLIHQSGRHLMAIVNDILDLTRMETGQLELIAEPVQIATVAQRAFEQATQLRLLENKQVSSPIPGSGTDSEHQIPQFSLEIEPGLEFLIADELRLRQMLTHLLSNALKFTEVDQKFGLKINRWGGWIAFTVWDSGIGIPAEKQHLIFQKFQQLENPLTRRFEGTGLGLVLTQRLARLHGGDVTFISKENHGSQFTILLPPNPPTKGASGSETGDPGWPSGSEALDLPGLVNPSGAVRALHPGETGAGDCNQITLVIEAIPELIENLSDQLTLLGYRIAIARTGTEALEKARRLQPCVIFLNPLLPLLSGWDVLTLLKADPQTQHIPVVVTASTVIEQQQAHHSHADDFLTLPVTAKPLQKVLKKFVLPPSTTEPDKPPVEKITVLSLNCGAGENRHQFVDPASLLHSLHYRILEADDLEQAELLARVWKPNVVLLSGVHTNWAGYFEQFSQHPFLRSLPLVTIDQEAARTANHIEGLIVFPCLTIAKPGAARTDTPYPQTLLQVIQIAAGYAWRPAVLAVDLSALIRSTDVQSGVEPGATFSQGFPQESEWLKATTQYLQMAGLRTLIKNSWHDVLQQIQSQTIDLLLLCWTEPRPSLTLLQMLNSLEQLPSSVPILVLDHRPLAHPMAGNELPFSLRQIAHQILPASLSMAELLEQIQRTIRH